MKSFSIAGSIFACFLGGAAMAVGAGLLQPTEPRRRSQRVAPMRAQLPMRICMVMHITQIQICVGTRAQLTRTSRTSGIIIIW